MMKITMQIVKSLYILIIEIIETNIVLFPYMLQLLLLFK